MKTLDKINADYEESKRSKALLEECLTRTKKLHGENEDSFQTMPELAKVLKELKPFCKTNRYELLSEVCEVSEKYVACVNAIDGYGQALLNGKNGKDLMDREIRAIQTAETDYRHSLDLFYAKTGERLDVASAFSHAAIRVIDNAIKLEKKSMEEDLKDVKDILKKETTVELSLRDAIPEIEELPSSMVVAKKPVREVTQEILRDIGIKSTYEDIAIELREQGNVLVNADFKNMMDHQIDNFVMAYIMKTMETFPLGSLHVHLFDQNTSFIFKRLLNGFQTKNAGESVKRIVQIHDSLEDLSTFRNIVCEDIFKKTSVEKPDLYAIYDFDKSDAFNLIVIRDGLVDGSGYAQTEMLDTINSLTKPNDMGHKCGCRFLIIDDSESLQNNLSETNKHLIELIKQNCEIWLNYSNGRFYFGEKEISPIDIRDDIDAYVEGRSKVIAEAIGKKDKSYVTVDDVSVKNSNKAISNIIYVPVGMSSGKTVEIPLSCKDEDGTVAGQCIGFMAIGQSGSGKSSFFHSVVLNGCMKYSPKDLQFWLLDFKNGGASSKYRKSGIPHVRIIAENNKIDDALCLFQMILEEMERRSKAFNANFTDNIIEYNKKALEDGLEYFPRIIIAIDEVQEIFRDDKASEIQKLISSISSRMRSAGMHFIMVAQNLSEGKAYMLKDAFLPSATGRICFRVAEDIPRDSGFGDEFIERRMEIAELNVGEAYVSYGKGTIEKVKMAFATTQDMSDKYFADIRNEYSQYANMQPLVIGSKSRLSLKSLRQGTDTNYYEIINSIISSGESHEAVIGEDVYRMSPKTIRFSQNENSSLLLLGSDKRIASSLCASVVLSLLRQSVKVHVFNGDRTRIQNNSSVARHPFLHVCQELYSKSENVEIHRLDQLVDVMRDMYGEYLDRQALVQKADFEDPTFAPIFLVINDLLGIESFVNNDVVEGKRDGSKEKGTIKELSIDDCDFNTTLFADLSGMKRETDVFRDGIQNIMSNLVKNGYRYNIHVILAINGSSSAWRSFRISPDLSNVVLFNYTEYSDQVENSYYLKEMLKNISNDGDNETMAVWYGKKSFSKIRPIIYDMFDANEVSLLNQLIEGE